MVTPSVLLSKFMGESEKLMSRMFSFAKHAAKTQGAAIIFLDEVKAPPAATKCANLHPHAA